MSGRLNDALLLDYLKRWLPLFQHLQLLAAAWECAPAPENAERLAGSARKLADLEREWAPFGFKPAHLYQILTPAEPELQLRQAQLHQAAMAWATGDEAEPANGQRWQAFGEAARNWIGYLRTTASFLTPSEKRD